MYAKAVALVSAILMESTVNAIVAGNTVTQLSNITDEKFLNLAQAEATGLNNAPYPYSYGYGDYEWYVK